MCKSDDAGPAAATAATRTVERSEAQLLIVQTRRRRWLFVFSCLYTVLFVGSFYSWGPFQLMMEQNSAFDWKCHHDTIVKNATTNSTHASDNALCPDQTSALLNVNLIAITTQILSPLLGHFIDSYGPKAGIYFLTACLWTGLTLLTIASSRNNPSHTNVAAFDRLLYVGYCLMALVTWMGGLLTVQVGMYFTGHTRTRVIFALNTLFDAGGVVYLGLWALAQSAPDVSLSVWMGSFLVLSVVIMSGSLYFWAVAEVSPDADDSDNSAFEPANDEEAEQISRTLSLPRLATSICLNEEFTSGVADEPFEEVVPRGQTLEKIDGLSFNNNALADDNRALEAQEPDREYVLVSDRSPKEQLLSYPFLLLCTFLSIQYTSYQWNMSTMREFLAYLGDDEDGNRYLTIFTLVLPAGIFALPLVDAIIIHFGFAGAFQCINGLALGYTMVKVCSNSLSVQIVGFLLFVVFCCVLFGVVFSFLPVLLSGSVVGKANGIMFALTGVTSFLCLPLARLAVQDLGGNFFIPNVIFGCLVLPCIFLSCGLGQCVKKEEEAKLRRQELLMVQKRAPGRQTDEPAESDSI
jgi:hypothetical protein